MRYPWIKYLLVALLGVFIFLSGCKKIDNNPENPFGAVDIDPVDTATNDMESIQWLHQNIFVLKCANPACHDGSFEPDFRTMQSTYSSLVYHSVKKNDPQNSYTYRVWPGNADSSWLYNRVTTNDQVLGRMPLYADPLSSKELDAIRGWINKGAPNVHGDLPQFPNLPPEVRGYQVLDTGNNRVDTTRTNGWASAMILNDNSTYNFVFYVDDDSTATADLKSQTVEFSLDRDNFVPFTNIIPVKLYENVTIAALNTTSLPKGQVIYFRYYLEDEQGAGTQMPSDQSQFWWKEHYALIVQ